MIQQTLIPLPARAPRLKMAACCDKLVVLDPVGGSSAINAFQRAKARLALLEHPEALAVVQRFEADSKFFRSLVIVLCVLIPRT